MFRRLLNAASIVCLVVCVALMGMWVRSYNGYDEVRGHFGTTFSFSLASTSGRLIFHRLRIAPSNWPWRLLSDERIVDAPRGQGFGRTLGFVAQFNWNTNTTNIELPYWLLVFVSGFLAAVFRVRWTLGFVRWALRFRFPWQFTLRSLFVATTIVAVVLVMILWLNRAWNGK
jgi:hypothetical protein